MSVVELVYMTDVLLRVPMPHNMVYALIHKHFDSLSLNRSYVDTEF